MDGYAVVAIFEKDEVFGVLGLFSTSTGTLLSRWDPRCNPHVRSDIISSLQRGKDVLAASIAANTAEGHKLVFLGRPNRWSLS